MDEPLPQTLDFEDFWAWIQLHPNCVLRAGTPEVMLFDDEDYHWHFGEVEDALLVVQLIRGKRMIGEVALRASHIGYVNVVRDPDEDAWVFELMGAHDDGWLYAFSMTHPYEVVETGGPRKWTH